MQSKAVPRLSAVPAGEIGPALRDGYEIHRAALRHGFDVSLLPRQVFTACHPATGTELAFVHGIPGTSNQSGVTYAQDKQMRRELLSSAGIPVPPGAAFAIGREIDAARDFAAKVGYPVVVKPRVGDNMIEVLPGLRNRSELDAAVDYLRTPPVRRPDFTRASYAITLLSEPTEEDGETFVPAGYRFLIERHVSGQYLRFLVLGERVSSVVHSPGGLGIHSEPCREVSAEVHPSVCDLVVAAVHAVPGLAVAAVDLVLSDYRKPANEQAPCVVEFSERPWLEMQARVSEELCHQVGEEIFTSYAAELSVPMPPAADAGTVRFEVKGATDSARAADALKAAADQSEVTCELDVIDRVEGVLSGNLSGSLAQAARIFELLVAGQLDGQRAMLINARPSQNDHGSLPRT